jgi:hypothetical protein
MREVIDKAIPNKNPRELFILVSLMDRARPPSAA